MRTTRKLMPLYQNQMLSVECITMNEQQYNVQNYTYIHEKL